MKGYLLDTSICIFLLRGNRTIEEKLNSVDIENCYITDVVVAELMFGAYYSNMVEENLTKSTFYKKSPFSLGVSE